MDIENAESLYRALDSKKLVIINFQSGFCLHCNLVKPSFKKLSSTAEAKDVQFFTVEVPDVPEVLEEFSITKVPTFIAFDAKKEIHRYVGTKSENLVKFFKDSLDLKQS